MKCNSILIFLTLFDDTTKEYLDNFKLSYHKGGAIKGIRFNDSIDNLEKCSEKMDILLVSDSSFMDFKIHDILEKHAAFYNDIFVVLHKNSPDNVFNVRKLGELLNQKMKLPILEESTSTGKAFDFLLNLSKAFVEKNEVKYQQHIRNFYQNFYVDYKLEAKLLLLNASQNKYHILSNDFQYEQFSNSNIAKEVYLLLSFETIRTVIKALSIANPTQIPKLKNELAMLLFSPSDS